MSKKARLSKRRTHRTVFRNGKQVRIRREPTIDGMPEDEFIARNADPMWLHQHGLWELIEETAVNPYEKPTTTPSENDDIPF